MNKDKILNLLGLAKKANLLVAGEFLVTKAIKKRQVQLVLLASDVGINTAKKIKNKIKYTNVPLDSSFTSQELSKAIGKAIMVVALTDLGFVKKFQELMKQRT